MILNDARVIQTTNRLEGLLEVEYVFFLDLTHLHSILLSRFSVDAFLDPSVGTLT